MDEHRRSRSTSGVHTPPYVGKPSRLEMQVPNVTELAQNTMRRDDLVSQALEYQHRRYNSDVIRLSSGFRGHSNRIRASHMKAERIKSRSDRQAKRLPAVEVEDQLPAVPGNDPDNFLKMVSKESNGGYKFSSTETQMSTRTSTAPEDPGLLLGTLGAVANLRRDMFAHMAEVETRLEGKVAVGKHKEKMVMELEIRLKVSKCKNVEYEKKIVELQQTIKDMEIQDRVRDLQGDNKISKGTIKNLESQPVEGPGSRQNGDRMVNVVIDCTSDGIA